MRFAPEMIGRETGAKPAGFRPRDGAFAKPRLRDQPSHAHHAGQEYPVRHQDGDDLTVLDDDVF